jgi:hypothetical protein
LRKSLRSLRSPNPPRRIDAEEVPAPLLVRVDDAAAAVAAVAAVESDQRNGVKEEEEDEFVAFFWRGRGRRWRTGMWVRLRSLETPSFYGGEFFPNFGGTVCCV